MPWANTPMPKVSPPGIPKPICRTFGYYPTPRSSFEEGCCGIKAGFENDMSSSTKACINADRCSSSERFFAAPFESVHRPGTFASGENLVRGAKKELTVPIEPTKKDPDVPPKKPDIQPEPRPEEIPQDKDVLCHRHQSSRCGKQGGTGGQALDCTGATLSYD